MWRFTGDILGPLYTASAYEYHEYAEQCIVLATKALHPGDRARLLQIAQAWRDLAEKLDANQRESIKSTEKDKHLAQLPRQR
jgi:uridine phosphorylase